MFEFVDSGSVTASFTPCIEDGVVGPYDNSWASVGLWGGSERAMGYGGETSVKD